MTEPIDYGEYIVSQEEIRHKIFKYFSLDTLDICKKVNRSWRKAAELTEMKRKRIQVMPLDNYEPGFIVCHSLLQISFYDQPENYLPEKAKYCYRELNIQSRLGVIGLDKKKEKVTMPRQRRFPKTPALATNRVTIRLPSLPNVHYHPIVIPSENDEIDFEKCWKYPVHFNVKAVILFSNRVANKMLFKFLQFLKQRGQQSEPIVISGGIPEDETTYDTFTFIAIGGENVIAAHTLLDTHCNTKDAIDTQIRSFRKKVDPNDSHNDKDSIIFAFRCCERRQASRYKYKYQPNENVDKWEAEALREHFPKSQCVGLSVNGEYGLEANLESKSLKSDVNACFHSYSTSLLFIGLQH